MCKPAAPTNQKNGGRNHYQEGSPKVQSRLVATRPIFVPVGRSSPACASHTADNVFWGPLPSGQLPTDRILDVPHRETRKSLALIGTGHWGGGELNGAMAEQQAVKALLYGICVLLDSTIQFSTGLFRESKVFQYIYIYILFSFYHTCGSPSFSEWPATSPVPSIFNRARGYLIEQQTPQTLLFTHPMSLFYFSFFLFSPKHRVGPMCIQTAARKEKKKKRNPSQKLYQTNKTRPTSHSRSQLLQITASEKHTQVYTQAICTGGRSVKSYTPPSPSLAAPKTTPCPRYSQKSTSSFYSRQAQGDCPNLLLH